MKTSVSGEASKFIFYILPVFTDPLSTVLLALFIVILYTTKYEVEFYCHFKNPVIMHLFLYLAFLFGLIWKRVWGLTFVMLMLLFLTS